MESFPYLFQTNDKKINYQNRQAKQETDTDTYFRIWKLVISFSLPKYNIL